MELSKQRGGSDLERQLEENVEKQEHRFNLTSQRGSASARGRVGGWRAASVILGMEFFERLSFLGIGLNLVTYVHDQMHLPLPRSANIVTNFMGTSYLTCLLGGFIADTYLGRYKTTTIGCCIQLLGMIMVTLSAVVRGLKPTPCDDTVQRCQQASTRQVAVLYIALYMIACGTGGIKSSLSGLGADQFEEATEEGRKHMQSFFNWFGASVSAGATLAITVLVYAQDNQGRGVGYAACAACMLLSLLLFLAGSRFYHSKPPSGSAFTCIAHVFVAAWRNRHLPLSSTTPSALIFHQSHPSSSHVLHTRQFSFLDRASLVLPSIGKIGELQSPWRLCSLEKVEEVKMVIRLLPILATTIVFWTANGQALTFSIEQGATLDRRLGKKFEIPPASFPVVLQLAMLITIPFYDRVLIPLARKWRGNEYGITNLQRIGVGLLLSTLAMVVAALTENKRLKLAHTLGSMHTRLPMSIFYLTPQYALVGIGEAFAYVGQLDFFYRESPDGMRSLSTGLCLSTLSFGLFLSSALVDGINKWTKQGSSMGWLANNLDDGRLDYFYWFLALLSFLSFLCYLICSHWYKYKHTWFMDADDRNKPLCNEKLSHNVKIVDQRL